MAYIKINLDAVLMDGHTVTFKAPCDCTAIDGLKVCYIEDGTQKNKIFTMKDTHGNNLAGIGNLFVKGAYVKVVLNSVDNIAYLQNADTNGYIERNLAKTITTTEKVLKDSCAGAMKIKKMFGKSIQKESPSPQNPQPIVSVGQMLCEGWQLANFPDVGEVDISGIVWSCKNGIVRAKGEATAASSTYGHIYANIPIVAGTYYVSGSNTYVAVKEADGTTTDYSSGKSFTLDGNEKTCRAYCKISSGKADSQIQPMVNEGTSVKPWEPYSGGVPGVVDMGIEHHVYGALVMNMDDSLISSNSASAFSCKGTKVEFSNTDGATRAVLTWFRILPKGTYTMYFKNYTGTNNNGRIGLGIGTNTEAWKTPGQREVFTLDRPTRVRLRATTSNQTTISTWSADVGVVCGDVKVADCPTGENLWSEPQIISFDTPNGLPGIPVSDASLANYTDEDGQMWCCDERDWVRGVDVKRVEKKRMLNLSLYSGNNAGTEAIGYYPELEGKVVYDGDYGMCNSLPVISRHIQFNDEVSCMSLSSYGVMIQINGRKTMGELNDYLDTNEIIAQYILAEPIETPIPEEEMAAWSEIKSKETITTILCDADVEIEYATNIGTTMVIGSDMRSKLNEIKISNIDKDITEKDAKIAALEAEITALKSKDTALENKITELENAMKNVLTKSDFTDNGDTLILNWL